MALSRQEIAERVGKRIREQDNRAGIPTTQEQAKRRAADLLNQNDNKKNNRG
jgi:hypothetical protein